jgi:hypothetical protein
VRTYPEVYGTRLDDCQTCHWGQTVTSVMGSTETDIMPSACDYCHYIQKPPKKWKNLPTDVLQTLNPYGQDYRAAGRDQDAVEAIGVLDSDSDTFSSDDEIAELRYPGSPHSYPGLQLCAMKIVTMSDIKKMSVHTQFGLANTTKQQFDYYATYTGVKIKDLLAAENIPTTTASNIEILAPDGFSKTFTMDEVNNQFPYHQYFPGFGSDIQGPDCSFVDYPPETYGYIYGDTIQDEQWHIIAYKREGLSLEPSSYNKVSGKIDGEGPFRNVIPPGSSDYLMNQPDRGENADTSGCYMPEWNYDINKDHNAGRMVKGVVVIRIYPLPTDCESFDIINKGWAMIDAQEMIIYGHSVE